MIIITRFLTILILLCKTTTILAVGPEYKYDLSISLLFQNEAPYLKEWIEYHKLLGVSHFYCYNHYSTDHYRDVLKPYIHDGTVELKDVLSPGDSFKAYYAMQCKCYKDCLNSAAGKSKWVAFIDADEFLVPMQNILLTDLLKEYESYGGVAVNWLMFGTSNLKKIPEGCLMIESLLQCAEKSFPRNRLVKSIVRPERVADFKSAHQPIYLDGYSGVNTDKIPFETDQSDYVLFNKLRINHYWTRDEDFFCKVKVPRQLKWGGQPNPPHLLSKMNAAKDETILRYVPALKKKLNEAKN